MSNRSLQNIVFNLKFNAKIRNVLEDGSAVQVAHPALSYKPVMADGVNALQANRGWQSLSRALSSGASETIDLYDMAGLDVGAGAGLDGLGQALALEEIVGIAIVNENDEADAGILEIIPNSSAGWSPIGSHTSANGGGLRGGGILFKAQPAEAGFDITDASNHIIKLTANGGAVVYSIYVVGRHDDDASSSSSSSLSSSSSSSQSSSSSSSPSSNSSSSSSSSSSSNSSSSSSS